MNFTYKPTKYWLFSFIGGIVGKYNNYSEDYDVADMQYSPEFGLNTKYCINKKNLSFALYSKYYGGKNAYYIEKNELKKGTIDPYTNIDLSVSKSFNSDVFNNDKLTLTLGLKNILGIENIETLSEIGTSHSNDNKLWGRSFFINLNYKF